MPGSGGTGGNTRLVRDMNPDASATDGRPIEVVANGLHVWRAPRSRLIRRSSAFCKGRAAATPRRHGAAGLALQQATRRHCTYPELLGPGCARCRLVVLGMETAARQRSCVGWCGQGPGSHGRRKPPDGRCTKSGRRSHLSPA